MAVTRKTLQARYSDISKHVHDLYGISVSTAAISAITDKIIDTVKAWQQRPLDSHYPFVWLDAIHYKVRAQGRYQNRAVYTVLGLNIEGKKEVLGLYLSESARSGITYPSVFVIPRTFVELFIRLILLKQCIDNSRN